MTRWLRDSCAPFLNRYRWWLLVASSGLCAAAAAAVVTQMQPAEELKFFSPEHPYQKTLEINSEEFLGTSDWKHQVSLTYGLASPPIRYGASSEFLRADFSDESPWSAVYDEGYDWGPQTQLRVAADCDAAALDKGLVADGEVYCVLNELRDWYPDAFPYESATVLHDALLDFYATSTYAQLKLDHENYASLTGFTSTTDGVAGGAVKAIFHAFNATIPQNVRPTPGSTGPWFDKWDAFASAHCATDLNCLHTTRLYSFYDVLTSLFSFAFMTTIVCVACSFVVLLLVTSNVLIAVFATVTIVAVITCVLAGILLLGFAFGMFECIFIILTCGMAIDYAVHLAHFYKHASGTRVERATSALHGVGLSIIGGAITTMGAGAPQFMCAILFFRLNGTFIFLTSGLALLFSFFMLIPLLMAMGPEAQQGELCFWRSASRSNTGKVRV